MDSRVFKVQNWTKNILGAECICNFTSVVVAVGFPICFLR
jgi:hypothetical protein